MSEHALEVLPSGEGEPSEFARSGGEILERDDAGRPRRWLCGFDKEGHKIDPPDLNGSPVLHELDARGRWEGRRSGRGGFGRI
ncbi:MAG: hypothetical protein HYY50_00910 [Candidatus Kerfeldbacteria bacterium]|nr:hypothetical protein [Candidatus Kerfeldbacteria bacterium]